MGYGFDKSRSLFDHPILELTKRGPKPLLSTLRTAPDAVLLRTVVEAAAHGAPSGLRLAAYAVLAEAAGPEAVWALELDRAGSLDQMEPEVRDSMASGTSEPLLAVAARLVAASSSTPASDDQSWRAAAELDQPVHHELEALIRAHLDGHPERWIPLLELMTAEPEAAVEELVARF